MLLGLMSCTFVVFLVGFWIFVVVFFLAPRPVPFLNQEARCGLNRRDWGREKVVFVVDLLKRTLILATAWQLTQAHIEMRTWSSNGLSNPKLPALQICVFRVTLMAVRKWIYSVLEVNLFCRALSLEEKINVDGHPWMSQSFKGGLYNAWKFHLLNSITHTSIGQPCMVHLVNPHGASSNSV
jgi:hypothetical protein